MLAALRAKAAETTRLHHASQVVNYRARGAATTRTRACDAASAVSYAYMEMFATYVCAGARDAAACVSSAVIPPLEDQLSIVSDMVAIQHSAPVSGFEGAVMQLLIARDGQALAALLDHVVALREAHDGIEALLRYIRATYAFDGSALGLV